MDALAFVGFGVIFRIDYVQECSKTLVHLRASSRLKVDGHLRNYILPTFGHFGVRDIHAADIRAWVAAMVGHGLSPATVKAVVGTLSRVMNQALIDGAVTRSPLIGLQLPYNNHVIEMKVLEPRQIHAVAEAVDPHPRAAPDPRCRRSRRPALSGARVHRRIYGVAVERTRRAQSEQPRNLVSAVVHVRESLVEVNGRLCLGATKTGATRKVALPRFLVELLEPQVRGKAPEAYAFTSKEGGRCGATSTSATTSPRSKLRSTRACASATARRARSDTRRSTGSTTSATRALRSW